MLISNLCTLLIISLGSSTKDFIDSEINIVMAEFKQSMSSFTSHITQAAAFGGLVAISVLPLLAVLVIGVGELLGHRYWLSSLLVAVACVAIGAPFAYRSFKKN